MKRILTVLSVLLILTGCTKKDNVTENVEKEKLIVAMELQYPPFEMSDESGDPAGVSVDIATDLADFLDREVVIENIAWTGLIPSLQTGKADIIISSMSITEKRAEVVDFSDPYISSGLSLLIAKDSKVQSYSDVDEKGIVVAVKSGTIGAQLAKEQFKNAEIRYFEEVSACVLEVAQGKSDVFIYDVLTVYENQQRHSDTTRLNIEPIPGSKGYWAMAVKKGNSELLEEVNKFIKEYKSNGGFDKLGDKYLGYIKFLFDESGIPFFFDIDE